VCVCVWGCVGVCGVYGVCVCVCAHVCAVLFLVENYTTFSIVLQLGDGPR